MKKTLIPMILLAAAGSATAQIKSMWSTTLADPMININSQAVAVAPDGMTYTLSSFQGGGVKLSAYDGLGARQWNVTLPMASGYTPKIRCAANGDPIIGSSSVGSTVYLMRVNRGDGSLAWNTSFAQGYMYGLELDAKDNIVILVSAAGGPTVRKYTPAGAQLFATQPTGMGDYSATSLSLAGNGLIYYTAQNGKRNAIVSLTPNGTYKWAMSWENWLTDMGFSYTMPSTVLSDKNGRAFTVEIEATDRTKVQVRTFDSSGNAYVQKVSYNDIVNWLGATLDSDARLVLADTVSSQNFPKLTVQWFNTSANGISSYASSKAAITAGFNGAITSVQADAFGQVYVFGAEAGATNKGMVWAFDPSKAAPVWSAADPSGNLAWTFFNGAVGKWGQIAMANTLDTPKTAESSFGIRQMGFRNMLINGSSFTGGRTITGTANFYSSDVADRNVALTSNSPYAKVGLTTTVLAGQSQSTFSVDLLPTAVRRAIRIEGTYNGTTRSVVFYLEPPVASSLTLFPTTVQGGKKVNATARINGDAPVNGINVALASNNAAATVPASVTILEGNVTQGFQVNTTTVSQTTTATLSATTGSVTKTATLTITP